MAALTDMTVPKLSDRKLRLFLRLLLHCDSLNHESSDISNYTDSAGVVIETILDLLEEVDIHSIPGDEWERFHELRQQCRRAQSLLSVPSIDPDIVLDECQESIDHYCYLLMFENPRWAQLIETLCLAGETIGQRRR